MTCDTIHPSIEEQRKKRDITRYCYILHELQGVIVSVLEQVERSTSNALKLCTFRLPFPKVAPKRHTIVRSFGIATSRPAACGHHEAAKALTVPHNPPHVLILPRIVQTYLVLADMDKPYSKRKSFDDAFNTDTTRPTKTSRPSSPGSQYLNQPGTVTSYGNHLAPHDQAFWTTKLPQHGRLVPQATSTPDEPRTQDALGGPTDYNALDRYSTPLANQSESASPIPSQQVDNTGLWIGAPTNTAYPLISFPHPDHGIAMPTRYRPDVNLASQWPREVHQDYPAPRRPISSTQQNTLDTLKIGRNEPLYGLFPTMNAEGSPPPQGASGQQVNNDTLGEILIPQIEGPVLSSLPNGTSKAPRDLVRVRCIIRPQPFG